MVRIAVIDREKCRPKDCGYACIKYCPLIKNKVEVIKIGEDGKPTIDENLCIGCGICVKKCPFNAIYIINLPDEIEEKKIFQYGPNSFRLYGLPIPKESSIIGIIGRNGIGKSTSIKILAGILKPNFGNFRKKADFREIIQKFKGTELQNFFEKLYNGKIKVSYKPQDLLLFRKHYGEYKVKDLLKKIDERKMLEKYIEEFNIKNILDRKIKELSGGELQKILIIASLLKDFNILFLDEPSAFLDIKERMRFAKIVNNEKEGKMIVLIEHDLAILDYLSDYIYIVYGKPKVYGIFSNRKSVKEGINEYLNGYLRSENIRIREKSIKFEVKKPKREKYEKYILEWRNIVKEYPGFRLEAENGNIGKTEIVGILGPNGIGKTTFLKIIAGKEEAEGEIMGKVNISYKTQYIEPMDIKVCDFLKKINSNFLDKEYLNEIIKPLGIDEIFDKNLKNLSGGELQVVYVAGCLIKEADLYILDEPSAFLDIEQRIVLARILKDFIKEKKKSCMVVDHDILFIDYISDSLIIFTGKPGKYGKAVGPLSMREGMNLFLKDLDVTFRRDPDTKRPRINKPGSYLDRKQKLRGEYYYV